MAKRALILAGGGLKVCYQAGVLQVWLDEAKLTFDHADGASGGTFNLAMYCQGMTGKQIADNWRNLDPFLPVDINTSGVWPFSRSLFTTDSLRSKVLPSWGIDWQKIRQSPRTCTFNVFNFSKKQLEVLPQSQMTEDLEIGAVSLPMWFPPVKINGDTYFDSVYITDGNLEEAVTRGADEIWAIWTVSRKDEWRDGFVNEYFQIIETVADTNFFTYWKRIEENNRRIANGEPGEFVRTIKLNLLEAEVPVHYLLNFSRDRMAEAVNQGVEDARAWCRARNIPLQPGPPMPTPVSTPKTSLTFTEEMKGSVAEGTIASTHDEYRAAAEHGKPLMFHLDITAADVDAFVTSPAHATRADGYIESPLYGGRCSVSNGTVNLFVNQADPSKKNMFYRLFFTAADGRPLTLTGVKDIEGPSFTSLWNETTTLYTQILSGHVASGQAASVVASGVVIIRPEDFFFKQLFSFRTQGPSLAARLDGLNRFGAMFFGKVWDVYGHQAGPV
ncbi:MAG: patatin-like phospholipase family protein [Vicinamibacterales bacterium]